LIRLQIGETEKIARTDILKQFFVLLVIKNDLVIFIAADTVVLAAFGTYEQRFPQIGDGTDVIAFRTLCPKSLRGFFFFRGRGGDSFLQALKPTGLGLFCLSFFTG